MQDLSMAIKKYMNNNLTEKNLTLAAIILAAGASKRMGRPKQLLSYQQETLLSYMAKSALEAKVTRTVVILGANATQIETSINSLPVEIVINQQWHEGISSSIRCGIEYIQKSHQCIEAVVFLTCDQPFVTSEIIDQLINRYCLTGKPIIASAYRETLGIPALFSQSFLPELMKLRGDRGAQKIIKQYLHLVDYIDFPLGIIDLDTPENYQKFLQRD